MLETPVHDGFCEAPLEVSIGQLKFLWIYNFQAILRVLQNLPNYILEVCVEIAFAECFCQAPDASKQLQVHGNICRASACMMLYAITGQHHIRRRRHLPKVLQHENIHGVAVLHREAAIKPGLRPLRWPQDLT